jgi:hypothetical protein
MFSAKTWWIIRVVWLIVRALAQSDPAQNHLPSDPPEED